MEYSKIEQDALIIEEGNAMMSSEATSDLYEVEMPEVEEIIGDKGEGNPVFNDFLTSDFGSRHEQVIKKMMAVAAVASGADGSFEEIASQADASAFAIKTAYKVAIGELDITRSTELLIDQGASRLTTFIQKKINLGWVGEKVIDVVALACPPARVLKPFVKPVLKIVEPVVRQAITKGVKTVATYAKKSVNSISTKVKSLVKKLFA